MDMQFKKSSETYNYTTYRPKVGIYCLSSVGGVLFLAWLIPALGGLPKNNRETIMYAGLMIIFTLGIGYLFWLYRYLKSYIVLAEDGISHVSPNGTNVSIRWNEITEIKRQIFWEKAKVVSATKNKHITIRNQIDGFFFLLNKIYKQVPALRTEINTFHILDPETILLFIGGLPLMIMGLQAFVESRNKHALAMGLLGLCGVLMALFRIRSITIDHDKLVIKYPFWTKSIPVREISSIEQGYVTRRANRINAVVIKTKPWKEIKIIYVKEGGDLLYYRLQEVISHSH